MIVIVLAFLLFFVNRNSTQNKSKIEIRNRNQKISIPRQHNPKTTSKHHQPNTFLFTIHYSIHYSLFTIHYSHQSLRRELTTICIGLAARRLSVLESLEVLYAAHPAARLLPAVRLWRVAELCKRRAERCIADAMN